MSGWLFFTLALCPAADPKPELANRALDADAVAHWQLAQDHESRRSKIWSPGPALVNYAKAIEIEPQYAAPYLDRGRLYFECDKLDEALADYNAAVRLLPQPRSTRGPHALLVSESHLDQTSGGGTRWKR